LNSGSLVQLLPKSAELWLDGGHNPSAGNVIAEWIKEQKKPVHLIYGMLKNKDARQFLAPVAGDVKSLSAVAIEGRADSSDPSYLSDIAAEYGIKSHVEASVMDAIKAIAAREKGEFI